MNLIQWKPSFSLGIPSVDLEHREMIGLINEAYERMLRSDVKYRFVIDMASLQ